MNGLHRLKILKKNPLTKEQMMALKRVPIPSPNYSSRGGVSVRLIVLHTAEGATSYQSLGSYFQNPASQVSSHTGIDDTPGVIGEYVQRSGKAWTQANANPYSIATELCAFAAWSPTDWAAHPIMLQNCAQWIAEESAAFGIPIVRLTAQQAQDGRSRGVCGHVDLGVAGGNHWDPGPSFPYSQVISMAQGGVTPPVTTENNTMWTLFDNESGGTWVLDTTGAIFAYDGAPYLGGCNNSKYNSLKWPAAGLSNFEDSKGSGYVITLDAGTVGGDRFRRYRFPRDGSSRV